MGDNFVCEHCGKPGQGDLSSSPPRLPAGWQTREILDVENRKAYIAIVCSEASSMKSAQSGSYLKWGRSRDL